MENTQIWKDVQGYEGLYQVSNMGNVKSLNYNKTGKERILKSNKNKDGYCLVGLYKERKAKTTAVHVIVAIAFLGHKPDGTHRIVPDHKDGDKSNNSVTNLELITQRENIERYWLTQKTSSQYSGVYWEKDRNKWRAQITIDGKRKHLGYFNCETASHIAYQKAFNNLLKQT
jgi:hypothetical protein